MCANFLGLKTRDDVDDKIYSNKPTLADRIILKIESLFEAQCIACLETYQNKLADTPLKSCFRCLQGSHNCDAMMSANKALSMPGSVWLCFGCYKQFDALAPTREKKSKNRKEDTVTEGSTQNDEGSQDQSTSDPSTNENADSLTSDENTSHDDVKVVNTPEICPLYIKNSCPHGISGKRKVNGVICKNEHPRGCPKYLRSGKRGCNKGNKNNKCKLFHSILCKFSVKHRRCINLQCTYVHLSNTKRWPISDDYPRPDITRDNTHPRGRPADQPGRQPREIRENPTELTQHQSEIQDFQLESSIISKLITDMRKDFQQELDQIKKQLSEQHTKVPQIPWQMHPPIQGQVYQIPRNAPYPPPPLQQTQLQQQVPVSKAVPPTPVSNIRPKRPRGISTCQ